MPVATTMAPVHWGDLTPDGPRPSALPPAPDPAAQANQALEAARARAKRIVAEARAEAEDIRRQAQAEAQRLRAEASQAGLEEGRAQGQAAVAEQREHLLEDARRLLEDARSQRQRLIDTLLPDITELSLAVARRVLGRELSASPEEVVDLARSLLAPKDGATVIWAHPDEAGLLEGWAATLEQPVEVRIDPGVGPRGVLMETSEGVVDATLPSRLRRAEEIVRDRPPFPAQGGTDDV